MVGPGRGSGAGSLVAYCIGITNIDPLRYNLIFERFLNPERISMPDFDVDFCYERRQEVIDYVIRKYGKDRVAQIITFGTMAARAAIRDVGRALNIPYAQVDIIAKKIPFELGMTIERALEVSHELRQLYDADETVKQLIDMSKALEGMPRHSSTHAAGVVISKKAVTEYVPLQMNEDVVTTQFPMGTLEELGLLKMDFLGLRTLTVIRDTLDIIRAKGQEAPDIENLDYNDQKVYKMISDGETYGVFQLESNGMTQFMKELKPSSLEDIIAGVSLYRPGQWTKYQDI
jgi:DNA polymerase-3 subunit alpha